jgi:drug/metabolite transporter (DMT)-like permease
MNTQVEQPPRTKVLFALAIVYVIWGSTYLGIRFAIESFPPFTMAGIRYLVAGLLMYGFARPTVRVGPSRIEWRDATIIGGSLLVCGNGGITFAEQYLPSGLVALLVTTLPVYMTLFAWWIGISNRPNYKVFVALFIGIIGVLILTSARKSSEASWNPGVVVPLIASAIWAAGSLFAKRAAKPSSANLSIGMQMIAGGVILLCLGLGFGEWARIRPELITIKSIVSLLYLVVFGSIIAFSAYVWLVRSCSPALVGTYAFVNPVVAVFLGWMFAGETIDLRMIIGSVVILVAVGLIILFPVPYRNSPSPAAFEREQAYRRKEESGPFVSDLKT